MIRRCTQKAHDPQHVGLTNSFRRGLQPMGFYLIFNERYTELNFFV